MYCTYTCMNTKSMLQGRGTSCDHRQAKARRPCHCCTGSNHGKTVPKLTAAISTTTNDDRSFAFLRSDRRAYSMTIQGDGQSGSSLS